MKSIWNDRWDFSNKIWLINLMLLLQVYAITNIKIYVMMIFCDWVFILLQHQNMKISIYSPSIKTINADRQINLIRLCLLSVDGDTRLRCRSNAKRMRDRRCLSSQYTNFCQLEGHLILWLISQRVRSHCVWRDIDCFDWPGPLVLSM